MNDAAIDLFTGVVALVVAGLLARRVFTALTDGVIPLYRTRLTRAEAGEAKFKTLVLFNAGLSLFMLVIGLDLTIGLGLRELILS
ncbi:hypothetical protein [Sphingomicrobium nitratireducens]|uniref:hypothetical protein n=1 Tax=Sphingomicrobium nitratireducens TaxID=2964666 RepID=UPI00223E9743|nr:hypothetical protein [Sphingomicrobium nitratireducens]